MSVSLWAEGLNKRLSVEQFKTFALMTVRKQLTKECHELEFKQDGKNNLWVGCKSAWSRGCWFSFADNSVSCITYCGRSPADMALQDVVIHELVEQYGGAVFDPQNYCVHKFNTKRKKWTWKALDPMEF